jgi:riboflavin kinase / FMN adenylyltransferase
MLKRRRIVDCVDDRFIGGAISIGNFDGVHRGHAELISRLKSMADRIGGPAVAVTFDPSPAAILRPDGVPPQLTTLARRTELLLRSGADEVVVCKTDRELLNQTAEEFFQNLVVEELAARGVVEGPNFYFGKNRLGNTQLLRQLCTANGIAIEIAPPLSDAESLISSTRVRELLTIGDVAEANRLLTAPYTITGKIVGGAARGRQMGFPTANLDGVKTLVPGAGVYACRASFEGKVIADAAMNIGPNPTFGESVSKIEVHLLDFEGDLYGCELEVELHSRIRGVVCFNSAKELTDQLAKDIASIRHQLRPTG